MYANCKKRAKKENLPFNITIQAIREKAEDARHALCQYCVTRINEKTISLDHIIPIQRGGEHTDENTETCCLRCNKIKGNMTKAEFRHFLDCLRPIDPIAIKSILARIYAGGRFICN